MNEHVSVVIQTLLLHFTSFKQMHICSKFVEINVKLYIIFNSKSIHNAMHAMANQI